MKTRSTIATILMFFAVLSFGQTNIPGGDVYGTWTLAGSPYLVEGDITVPADYTLVVEPGVVIDFQGNYITQIFGNLLAQGTESDTIYFISSAAEGHRGLKYIDVPEEADSSIFTYCRFQDGRCAGSWPYNCGGGIGIMYFDKVRIEHCLFIDNQALNGPLPAGGAIALADFDGIIRYNTFIDNSSTYGGGIMAFNNSDCIISHNVFYDNYAIFEGGGIQVWGTSDPQITHNTFVQNRADVRAGAISLYDNSHPLISHNLFYDNLSLFRGGALFMELGCQPLILNNTFSMNHASDRGGAVEVFSESCPLFINNIIWGNTSPVACQVNIDDPLCVPDFFNNDIQYGKDSIGGFHVLSEWKSNIDLDPLFMDVLAGNFHLDPLSPCIDAGTDTITDPDGTVSDIGAFYYHQLVGIQSWNNDKNSLSLFCYPNPVVEEVYIRCMVPGTRYQDVELVIFDLQGRKVDGMMMDQETVMYNASHLPAGTYVLRLQAGNRVVTGKLVKR